MKSIASSHTQIQKSGQAVVTSWVDTLDRAGELSARRWEQGATEVITSRGGVLGHFKVVSWFPKELVGGSAAPTMAKLEPIDEAETLWHELCNLAQFDRAVFYCYRGADEARDFALSEFQDRLNDYLMSVPFSIREPIHATFYESLAEIDCDSMWERVAYLAKAEVARDPSLALSSAAKANAVYLREASEQ